MKKLLLILFFTTQLFAQTNWYVRPATGEYGLEDGSDWDNAFDGFTDIAWGSIGAGDTLFMSGGVDTAFYYQTLTISASGTVGNEIVVTSGNDAGHNGIVYIDGERAMRNGVTVTGDNIIFDGQNRLEIWYAGYDYVQGSVNIDGGSSVTITRIYISNNTGGGCIRFNDAPGIKLTYNTLIGGSEPCPAHDQIIGANTNGILIDHNTIISNRYNGICPTSPCNNHDDNIQFYHPCGNYIISNNYMYDHDTSKCHQVLIFEQTYGTNVLYNNVMYFPNKTGYGNTILEKNTGTGILKYYVIGNTIISGDNQNQFAVSCDSLIAYNNLFHCTSPPPGGAGIDADGDWTKKQGNHFGHRYTSGGGGWNGLSLTTLNSYGAETFGNASDRWHTDPYLINGADSDAYPNEDLSPTDSSLLRNNGIYDLGGGQTLQDLVESFGLVWEDIEGNARDETPDIGAYEYVVAGTDTSATVSFSSVTNAALNSYHIAYGVLSGADTTFWVLSSPDSFAINYPFTFDIQADTAHTGDTIAIPCVASGTNATSVTKTIKVSGVNRTFTVTTIALADTIPAQITLIDFDYADLSTGYTSFPFMLTEFDSCNFQFGGEDFEIYRSGSWGSPSATMRKVYDTDSIRLNLTSSGSNDTEVNAELNAGGMTDTWSVTTKGDGEGIDSLGITNVEGETQEATHPPSKTIDGLLYNDDIDSRWAAEPVPKTLVFDLGQIETVVKLEHSFAFWYNSRIWYYSIDASLDNSTWYEIWSQDTTIVDEEWDYDSLDVGYRVRYIRLNFIGQNQNLWAGLIEEKIYGTSELAVVDSVPSISFTDLTGVYQETTYITTGVFSGADTTFQVSIDRDSLKINYNGTWTTVANGVSSGDTCYIAQISGAVESATTTSIITAGGANFGWNITTLTGLEAILRKILPGN